RAHVEPGPADQDGDASATADIVECGARVALVAIDVVTLARLDHVDEVMANARALFARRLRRADVHASIDQARVGRDHLCIETLGDPQRESGVARCRGTDDPAPGRSAASSAPTIDAARPAAA